eukprot:14143143-Alexandrium_andersonii.AAC.1
MPSATSRATASRRRCVAAVCRVLGRGPAQRLVAADPRPRAALGPWCDGRGCRSLQLHGSERCEKTRFRASLGTMARA